MITAFKREDRCLTVRQSDRDELLPRRRLQAGAGGGC
eukprot:SAG22_NODE_2991_length_2044_cov_1.840617_1_plen_36_part_10